MKRTYVLQAFTETPWAILPSKLAALAEIVSRHVAGEKLSAEEIQAQIHGGARPENGMVNNVAVLRLFGTIVPRASMFTDISGATSAERFGADFEKLINDPGVSAIVLDVNSPGGQVRGVQEVSDLIHAARGKKPIVAVANHLMASAAYWIATAADEVVVTPSSEVGSIGVFAAHEDVSKSLEQDGVKVSLISAGKYKVEGNPYEPLTEEARAAIQEHVNEVYDAFTATVARNRGVDVEAVRDGFGEGRTVNAQQAVSLGMADRVGTLAETLDRLFNKNVPSASSNASELGKPQTNRQEPVVNDKPTQSFMQAHLARVEKSKQFVLQGDSIMNLRELMKARSEKLARAEELAKLADAESRDFTEAERKEFEALLGVGEDKGEIGALDAQIAKITDERTRLRAAKEKKLGVEPDPQKPDGSSGKKVMKRPEFEKLDASAQAAFIRDGGKLED